MPHISPLGLWENAPPCSQCSKAVVFHGVCRALFSRRGGSHGTLVFGRPRGGRKTDSIVSGPGSAAPDSSVAAPGPRDAAVGEALGAVLDPVLESATNSNGDGSAGVTCESEPRLAPPRAPPTVERVCESYDLAWLACVAPMLG